MPVSPTSLSTDVLKPVPSSNGATSVNEDKETQYSESPLLAPCAAHGLRLVVEDPDQKSLAPRGWVDLWISEAAIAQMREDVPDWMAWQKRETTHISTSTGQQQRASLREAKRVIVSRTLMTLGEHLLGSAQRQAFAGSLAMTPGRAPHLADDEFVALIILCAKSKDNESIEAQLKPVQEGLIAWARQFLPDGQWAVAPGQLEQLQWDDAFQVQQGYKQIRFWKPSGLERRLQFADFARAQLEHAALTHSLGVDPLCASSQRAQSHTAGTGAACPAEGAAESGVGDQTKPSEGPEPLKKGRSSLRI